MPILNNEDYYKSQFVRFLAKYEFFVTVKVSYNYTVVSAAIPSNPDLHTRNILKHMVAEIFPEAINIRWLELCTKVYEIDNGPPKMCNDDTHYAIMFEVDHNA